VAPCGVIDTLAGRCHAHGAKRGRGSRREKRRQQLQRETVVPERRLGRGDPGGLCDGLEVISRDQMQHCRGQHPYRKPEH
jgi:hypothetical protein